MYIIGIQSWKSSSMHLNNVKCNQEKDKKGLDTKEYFFFLLFRMLVPYGAQSLLSHITSEDCFVLEITVLGSPQMTAIEEIIFIGKPVLKFTCCHIIIKETIFEYHILRLLILIILSRGILIKACKLRFSH